MATYTVTDTGNVTTNGTWFQDILSGTNNSGQHSGVQVAPGDTIILPANVDSRRSHWAFPNLGAGSSYVTIQTSALNSLPANTRPITSASSALLTKLTCTGGNTNIFFASGAHHYKFIGVIFTHTADLPQLIVTGSDPVGGGDSYSYANRNTDLYFDRCWIREATNDTTTSTSHITTCTRGVQIAIAENITFKGCRIAGFRCRREPTQGPESTQAILWAGYSYNSLVEDCYLESWFTPLFFASGGEPINTATISSVSWSGTYTVTTLTCNCSGTNLTATSGSFTAAMDGEYMSIGGSLRIFTYINSTTGTVNSDLTVTGATTLAVSKSGTFTGSATFSNVTNLAIGDHVRFRTTGGKTPVSNSAHIYEAIIYQVAKVTNIVGSVVSFAGRGSYDSLNNGNPLLQSPDSPGECSWNGRHNEAIIVRRCQFYIEPTATEIYWQETGGDPTASPRTGAQVDVGNAPKGFIEIKAAKNVLITGCTFDGWYTGLGTLTSRNQGNITNSGGFPWSGLYDITIEHCYIKKMFNWDRNYSGVIGGLFLEDNEATSQPSGPFEINNCLFDGGAETFLGAMCSGIVGAVTIDHCTYPGYGDVLGGRNAFIILGEVVDTMTLKNCFVPTCEYILNNSTGESEPFPNKIWQKIVWIDNRSAGRRSDDGGIFSSTYNVLPGNYQEIITAPADMNNIGWRNTAIADYRLLNSSDYKNAGTDGKDIGVVFTEMYSAMGENWPFSWSPYDSVGLSQGLDW